MARVFITGSSDGLGLAAGRALIDDGHEVVLHARNEERADDTRRAAPGLAEVLVGDLSSARETADVAAQANASGRFDAVIHNAGVGYREPRRIATPEGHSHLLAINVLAPYALTALMTRPDRLIYLSSSSHLGGHADVRDLDWTDRPWNGSQAYGDSKLLDAALAFAVARRWPSVLSNAVEPGWVPTKMGGRGAPDDLALGHVTQAWLATSADPAARATGQYFFHQRAQEPLAASRSERFQDELVGELARLTGVELPGA